MISCKQVATALASAKLDVAGPRRRLAVWFHLMICRYCRAYARQMRALGDAARRLLGRTVTDPEALRELEERLVERCRRRDDPTSG